MSKITNDGLTHSDKKNRKTGKQSNAILPHVVDQW